MTELTFETWLFEQQGRQDPVGRLARALANVDVSYMQASPRRDEHKKWANIVTRHARNQHVSAFNTAWREFLRARDGEKAT